MSICIMCALTCCDTQTSVEVVNDREDSRLPLERNPVGRDEANGGNDEDEKCVEPVDVKPPVTPSNGLAGDVRLLGVGPGTADGDIVLGTVIPLLGGCRRHRCGCHGESHSGYFEDRLGQWLVWVMKVGDRGRKGSRFKTGGARKEGYMKRQWAETCAVAAMEV
ncbi:hypothetical protein EV126DRAFT_228558 [Verticillium dahliae]|nr:hypothetical protein EV126DRAFT_228558 [Verticillium dahliae]